MSTQYPVCPLQAVVDYARGYWRVKDDEIRRLGVDLVSWRSAQLRAVLASCGAYAGHVAGEG